MIKSVHLNRKLTSIKQPPDYKGHFTLSHNWLLKTCLTVLLSLYKPLNCLKLWLVILRWLVKISFQSWVSCCSSACIFYLCKIVFIFERHISRVKYLWMTSKLTILRIWSFDLENHVGPACSKNRYDDNKRPSATKLGAKEQTFDIQNTNVIHVDNGYLELTWDQLIVSEPVPAYSLECHCISSMSGCHNHLIDPGLKFWNNIKQDKL